MSGRPDSGRTVIFLRTADPDVSRDSSLPVERNVGGRDRTLRAALGVAALAVALASANGRRRGAAVVFGAAAVGLLFNAVTCFCGLNAWLGIDTTEN